MLIIESKSEYRLPKYNNPEMIASLLRSILVSESEADQDREHFWVVGLDNQLHIRYVELVSLGAEDQAIVKPIQVYRTVVAKGVPQVIFGHNHPACSLTPSSHDVELTRKLAQAGDLLEVRVLDHVIIGSGKGKGFYSFQESNPEGLKGS